MSVGFDLLHGDALDRLAEVEGPLDATITDPPYCAGAISEAGRTRAAYQGVRSQTASRFSWFENDAMGTAGLVWLLRSVASEVGTRTVDGGWFLCFCDWRMIASIQPAIESAGWSFRSLVIWNKGAMGLGVGFRAQHESILAFSRGSATPKVYDKGVSNVLTVPRVAGGSDERDHPTQKPLRLLDPLVRVTSPEGGRVCDPFAGSGSTGVAALRLGRSFVGIEVNEEHAATARRRLSAEVERRATRERGASPIASTGARLADAQAARRKVPR